jgi:glutaredoxin
MEQVAIRTLEQVEAEIAQTQQELENVHGTTTEVYARIVGYYRAVRNWNKGKADEFKHRKVFTLEDSKEYNISDADAACDCNKAEPIANPATVTTTNCTTTAGNTEAAVSYEFYARKTCPNCPPVKEYMANVSIAGTTIDVDTETGLSQAAEKGVFAAPTVIVYNANGVEIARAHNVNELSAIFQEQAVAV